MSLIFRQLFDHATFTYTYLLGDPETKEAVIIDPVIEQMERDSQFIGELGLDLKWILETHVHADHVTASGTLREKFGAKIALSQASGVDNADLLLADGESIQFGKMNIKTILTPGHTNGCCSFLCENRLFSGDALMIRGCGRTDFQQGSASGLFHSVREKLFKLPDSTLVYPGHDYKGRTCSSIGEEKQNNPRLKLTNSEAQFVEIMGSLNLAPPKRIDVAVPANLKSGLIQS